MVFSLKKVLDYSVWHFAFHKSSHFTHLPLPWTQILVGLKLPSKRKIGLNFKKRESFFPLPPVLLLCLLGKRTWYFLYKENISKSLHYILLAKNKHLALEVFNDIFAVPFCSFLLFFSTSIKTYVAHLEVAQRRHQYHMQSKKYFPVSIHYFYHLFVPQDHNENSDSCPLWLHNLF